MKTLLKILFLMAVISLTIACGETEEFVPDADFALKSGKTKTVTVPFEVNLLGEISELIFDDAVCLEEGYPVRAIVEASGNATHMGKVTLTFNFCSGGAPDSDIEGAKYTYAGFTADLIAANGDVLHLISNDGIVLDGRTDEHPEDAVEYWRTPISVLGGTGRFEGATGNLISDDYVTSDEQTHHRFYGEITLVKGKK